MSRVRYQQQVEKVLSGILSAPTGAPWEVRLRGSGTAVTFFTSEAGAGTVAGTAANLTSRDGRVEPVATVGGELWLDTFVEYDEYSTVDGLAVGGGNPLIKVGAGGGPYADRRRLVYNALDYGISNTGATDQSTAIAAFYTLVPAGSVAYFPTGIYQGLHAPGKTITILGDGKHRTEFRPPAAPAATSKMINFGTSTKCALIGVKLNAQNITNIARGVDCQASGTDKHLLITQCWFENFTSLTGIAPHAGGAAAIYVWTADAVEVSNCNFVDCVFGPYMDSPSIDCVVTNNKTACTPVSVTGTATSTTGTANLTAVTPTTFVNGQTISGTGIPGGTTIISGGGTASMVMSNVITGSGIVGLKIDASTAVAKAGILLRRSSTAASGSLVAFNTVENVRSDPGGIGTEGHGIDLIKVQGVRVIGNTVRDCQTAGIHVGGGSYGAMVLGNNLSECTIRNGGAVYVELNIGGTVPTTLGPGTGRRNGCTIIGNTVFLNARYGLSMSFAAGSMITANTIYENGAEGIFVDSDYVSINGNQVYNSYNLDGPVNPTSAPNIQAQIRVTAGLNCIISDNTVTDNQVTPTSDYGIAVTNNSHSINSNQVGTHVVGDIYNGGVTNDVQGYGQKVKEAGVFGTVGLKMGRATLAAGTVTVNTAAVTAASEIWLMCQVPGGTPGFLRISARTAGTSFTILSSSGTDTSIVSWWIVEPG